MFARDLVRIYSFTDRKLAHVLVDKLDRAGIGSVFLPSDQAIGVWELEVDTDDVDRARAIVEECVGPARVGRSTGRGCYACERVSMDRCRLCDSEVCPEHAEQSATSGLLVCITCTQTLQRVRVHR